MTERLADQLAGLRLSSPSPATATGTPYAVQISEAAASVREAYRCIMNPRDMQNVGLAAGSLVAVEGLLLEGWPSMAVTSRTIRLSPAAVTMLALRTDQQATVSPWTGHPSPPEKLQVSCRAGGRTVPAKDEHDLAKTRVLAKDEQKLAKGKVPAKDEQKMAKAKVLTKDEQELEKAKALTKDEQELVKAGIRQLPCIQGGFEYAISIATRTEDVRVTLTGISVAERLFGPCTKDTELLCMEASDGKLPDRRPDDPTIGGLEDELQKITDAIGLSLKHAETLSKYRVKAPRGILLFGPPGTGKTLLARAVASRMGLNMVTVDGVDLIGRYYGESESKLSSVFADAATRGPSIVFIDELDALCPRRDANSAASDSRLVATLLTLMDGLASRAGDVFVLAATNAPDSIDTALRRPGRFDCEIEIGIPNRRQREEILRALLTKHPLVSDACQAKIAGAAHGFVGADLHLVVKEATLSAVQRGAADITDAELADAFARVKPSAIRDILLEIPQVSWDQIGGQEATKQKLKESVEWPLKHPEKFLAFGIGPPKGVLLYGPPGCSKTMLAKALATESGLNFMAVKGPELFSKWVGDSEKAVREIFRKARLAAPSIIFFDEFDAIGAKRASDSSGSSVSDRVISQLLSEMDGTDPLVSVTVIAATNRPDIIDPALLRPGRFDRLVYVALPDLPARRDILTICSRRMPFDSSVDIEMLAGATEGYSGAEVSALCQEAALQALQENIDSSTITSRHFGQALGIVKPRTPPEMIKFFDTFARKGR